RNRHLEHAVRVWEGLCAAQQEGDFESKLKAFEALAFFKNEDANAQSILQAEEALKKAADELRLLRSLLPAQASVVLDLTLARGLSYYTGAVFEVSPKDERLPLDFRLGSIGGGGRYDNLTGAFGLPDVPGVGVSFGLDRIYDTMEAAGLFDQMPSTWKGILFCPMDEASFPDAVRLAREVRHCGYAAEVYPSAAKLKKQLDYANQRGWCLAAILGENERLSQTIALKDLNEGSQSTVSYDDLVTHIKTHLPNG
ncbi:MAG: ATP phosphoribosyltransferase regulatory subunit, partial [Bacteroidia bacterium]